MQRPPPASAWLLLLVALLHVALAFMIVSRVWAAGDRTMQMTYREQFSNWDELLRLADANASREDILSAAWCNFTRPDDTAPPAMCACVDAQIAARNGSAQAPRAALVAACLRRRGTWRVSHSWRIHPATSAFFVLLATACFLVTAVEHPPVPNLWAYACWGAAAASLALLGASDPAYNALWVIASFSAAISITFVLAPGLRAGFADLRYESCFWWAEFFAAPVFALDAVVFNSGRDLAYALAAIMMGTLLAGAGLRCTWYSVAFAEHPRIVAQLQWCAWLLIVAISSAFALLTSAYHRTHPTLVMPNASVAMLGLTCLISLLQLPWLPRRAAILLQSAVALARNLTLAGALWHDLA